MGPRWNCQPPKLTVVIRSLQTEGRFGGMNTVYEVKTRELASCVQRHYKHFLWLYDRLAELFPCISLPPMPVKQFSGECVLATLSLSCKLTQKCTMHSRFAADCEFCGVRRIDLP